MVPTWDAVGAAFDAGVLGVDEGRTDIAVAMDMVPTWDAVGADDAGDFGVDEGPIPDSHDIDFKPKSWPRNAPEVGADMGAERAPMMRGDLGVDGRPCSNAMRLRAQMATDEELQRGQDAAATAAGTAQTTTELNNFNKHLKLPTCCASPGTRRDPV